jgi:hypothetical protein
LLFSFTFFPHTSSLLLFFSFFSFLRADSHFEYVQRKEGNLRPCICRVYHSHSHQSSVKHRHTRHAPDVSTTSRMWPIPNCSSTRCNHQPACVRWSLSADQHWEKTGLHDSTASSPLPVPSISSSAGASAVRNFPARRFNCSTWSSHPYRDR